MNGRLQFSLLYRADLPASACAVSRLALQDHAELLEEEHKGAALLPGNTQSPAGIRAGTVFKTPSLLISGGNGTGQEQTMIQNPGLSYLVSVEKQSESQLGRLQAMIWETL